MASKKFYHDIDLGNVGQVIGARKQNVTTAQRDALALGAGNAGLQVWDTDLKQSFTWDGAQFVRDKAAEITGNVIFKGTVDASVTLDATSTTAAQAEAKAGNQYVVTTAGTLTMTGVTFSPSAQVQASDTVLFTSASEAYVFEGNDQQATTTEVGNVRLATDAEAIAGTENTAAVTSAALAAKLADLESKKNFARVFAGSVDLLAGTAKNVVHNLGLASKDGFTINVMSGGEQVEVAVKSIDVNTVEITSSVAVTGADVTVVGA